MANSGANSGADSGAHSGADFSEFKTQWRPLLACFLGVGSALSLNSYILNTFAPYLLEEFGWSRSQWAMAGIAQILVMICLPIAGRLTDVYGVRRIAAVGALSFPVFLVLITQMSGSFTTYLAIYIAQTIVCSTTTSTVYTRVVASAFKMRRGLALGIAGMGPPVLGALGAPLATELVSAHGWRTGYYVIAAFCLLAAVVTLALLPKHEKLAVSETGKPKQKSSAVYKALVTSPLFWLMLIASFLVNTPFTLAISQLKLVVLEQGLDDATAALLVSVFAISSIVGRIIAGLALDVMSAARVAAVSFLLPVAGLLLLASPFDTVLSVSIAIALIGATFGAEGDILPFLVTRYFGIGIYSTVLGIMLAAMGGAMALGNLLVALTIDATGSFNTYLLTAAACTAAGAIMFLMMDGPKFRRGDGPAIGAD